MPLRSQKEPPSELGGVSGTTAGTNYITVRHDGVSTDTFTATSATGSNTATVAFNSTPLTQVAGQVGIGTVSPATGVKADIDGSVKVAGSGTEPCNANTVGQMRYNAAGGYMEICTYP